MIMKCKIIILLALFGLIGCGSKYDSKCNCFPFDVEWTYEEIEGASEPQKSQEEIIDSYISEGFIVKDNVIYLPQILPDHSYLQIRGCLGNPSEIVIPDEIDGLPVEMFFYGFKNCTNLKKLHIGKNIQYFGADSLVGCKSLTEITIDEQNQFISFNNGFLFEKNNNRDSLIFVSPLVKDNVVLPNTITVLNLDAFSVSDKITKITTGEGISSIIGGSPLPLLEDFVIPKSNPFYLNDDGVIYTKDKSAIVYVCANRHETFEIPSEVTQVSTGLFSHCQKLKTLVLNDNVKDKWGINPNSSTYGVFICSTLENIVIKDTNQYITSFDGCVYTKDLKELVFVPQGKKEVTLYDNLETIRQYSFLGSKLETLTIPDSVTYIGDSAFENCDFESMVLGKGVKEIADTAFTYFTGLKNLFYHGTVEEISKIQIHKHNKYLVLSTRYYFSETKPDEKCRYWHYVDGEINIW